jgi:hypothetical protein
MSINDCIGSVGVLLVLLAFFAHAWGRMHQGGWYFFLNTLGGALSCLAAVLIHYWPFMLLEGIWTLVSIAGWIRVRRQHGLLKQS